MARRQIAGLRCIVTGASSGIGFALAKQLLDAGAKIVVTARRAERLQELAGDHCHIVAGDITSPQIRQQLIAECINRYGGLDVLINNAGIGGNGPFATADAARLRNIFEVNVFAPLELIRLAIPKFDRSRHPAIVNISSVLGHRAVPGKSEYCASKFALHGFSDALRAELASEGIDVILVSPSATATEFFDRSAGDPESVVRMSSSMSAGEVARRTVVAIARGNHEVILSWGGWILVWIDKLFPDFADWMVSRFGKR